MGSQRRFVQMNFVSVDKGPEFFLVRHSRLPVQGSERSSDDSDFPARAENLNIDLSHLLLRTKWCGFSFLRLYKIYVKIRLMTPPSMRFTEKRCVDPKVEDSTYL